MNSLEIIGVIGIIIAAIVAFILLGSLAAHLICRMIPPDPIYPEAETEDAEDTEKEEVQPGEFDPSVCGRLMVTNKNEPDSKIYHITAVYINWETKEIIPITPFIQDSEGFLAFQKEIESGEATVLDLDDLTYFKDHGWEHVNIKVINY